MEGLAELHTHLGGSVASEILWSLAHEQGIALPVKDFWEFDRLVTVSDPRGVANLDALDAIYHWTELIQSSPIERRSLAPSARRIRSRGTHACTMPESTKPSTSAHQTSQAIWNAFQSPCPICVSTSTWRGYRSRDWRIHRRGKTPPWTTVT